MDYRKRKELDKNNMMTGVEAVHYIINNLKVNWRYAYKMLHILRLNGTPVKNNGINGKGRKYYYPKNAVIDFCLTERRSRRGKQEV